MKINIIDNFQSESTPPIREVKKDTSTSFKFRMIDEYISSIPLDPNLLYKHYDPAYYWNLPFRSNIIDDFGILAYAYSLATEDYYALMLEDYENYGDTSLILEWS